MSLYLSWFIMTKRCGIMTENYAILHDDSKYTAEVLTVAYRFRFLQEEDI